MNEFCVFITDSERAAQRIAQYIEQQTELGVRFVIEKPRPKYYIFATSSKRINQATITQLYSVAAGIDWMLKHYDDLVKSVFAYPHRVDIVPDDSKSVVNQ